MQMFEMMMAIIEIMCDDKRKYNLTVCDKLSLTTDLINLWKKNFVEQNLFIWRLGEEDNYKVFLHYIIRYKRTYLQKHIHVCGN